MSLSKREEKDLVRGLEDLTGVPVRHARVREREGRFNVRVEFAEPVELLTDVPVGPDGVLRIEVGGPS